MWRAIFTVGLIWLWAPIMDMQWVCVDPYVCPQYAFPWMVTIIVSLIYIPKWLAHVVQSWQRRTH